MDYQYCVVAYRHEGLIHYVEGTYPDEESALAAKELMEESDSHLDFSVQPILPPPAS